jgi:hypothetical protein
MAGAQARLTKLFSPTTQLGRQPLLSLVGTIRPSGQLLRHRRDQRCGDGPLQPVQKAPSTSHVLNFAGGSIREEIPWRCRRLVVGTGAQGGLPVMDEVLQEAKRRKVELLSVPTEEATAVLNGSGLELGRRKCAGLRLAPEVRRADGTASRCRHPIALWSWRRSGDRLECRRRTSKPCGRVRRL